MNNRILKNVWLPLTIIPVFVLILFLGIGLSLWIYSWVPAALCLFLAIILLPFIFYTEMSAITFSVNISEEGIKLYFFKRERLFVKWDDISNIRIYRPYRNGRVINIKLKNSSRILDIDYRKKSKELFLRYCPNKTLLTQFSKYN